MTVTVPVAESHGGQLIKVLIVDDHRLVREGLKKILAETRDIVVAGEADGGHEALQKTRKTDYDVIILDISMAGKSGIEVLDELKKEKPKSQVLIVGMHPEEQYALRAMKSGAAGYLTKESTPAELIDAIHRVAAGKRYLTPAIAEYLALAVQTDGSKPLHEKLSNREYQIFCMIAKGKTVSGIATDLILSSKTVSTYRARVLQKMGMKNNSELIYYAVKNDLVV